MSPGRRCDHRPNPGLAHGSGVALVVGGFICEPWKTSVAGLLKLHSEPLQYPVALIAQKSAYGRRSQF
jgi:hypothetical protein